VIDYIDVVVSVVIVLGLIRLVPTRWFSKEEKFRHESAKRLKTKLRK